MPTPTPTPTPTPEPPPNPSDNDNLSEDNDIITSLSNYYSKLTDFEIFNNNGNIVVLYIIVDINIQNKIYDSLVDRIYRSSSGNILNLI